MTFLLDSDTYGRSGGLAAQIFRRLLRGGRVDEEPRPPLEAGHPGELRDDLQVPVEVVEGLRSERRAVEHEVVWRVVEELAHPAEYLPHHRGQPRELPGGGFLVA